MLITLGGEPDVFHCVSSGPVSKFNKVWWLKTVTFVSFEPKLRPQIVQARKDFHNQNVRLHFAFVRQTHATNLATVTNLASLFSHSLLLLSLPFFCSSFSGTSSGACSMKRHTHKRIYAWGTTRTNWFVHMLVNFLCFIRRCLVMWRLNIQWQPSTPSVVLTPSNYR